MTERFIVDDAGTLIDMQTRDTYDYVSDVVTLLNELHEENQRLQEENKKLRDFEYFVFKSIGELNEKRGE